MPSAPSGRCTSRVERPMLVVLMLAMAACSPAPEPAESSAAAVQETTPAVAAPAVTAPPPAPVAAGPVDLQDATIIDASFGQPIVAASLRIPAGWNTEGGVGWDRGSDCVGNHMRLKWRAVSADGRESFEIMPGYSWQLQGTEIPMYPCPVLPIRTARGVLQMVVQQRYAGAQELEYQERPDLARQLVAKGQDNVNASQDAGQLLIVYPREGQQVFEMLTTMVNITEVQGNVAIGAPAVYAHRVIGARPDLARGNAMRDSMRAKADWVQLTQRAAQEAIARISQNQQNRIATWHAGEMTRINARGAADRSQIAMQTQREVAQIYSDGWQRSQATDERIQRRTLEAIGGYNTYDDPAGGGVVRGSIEYDRVLRHDNGGYTGTNDPNYNPAGSQELERIP